MANEPAIGQRSTATARVSGGLTEQSGNPVAKPQFQPSALFGECGSVEAPRRVRKHGVNLTGFRGQIGSCDHLTAIVAGHFVEQTLKLGDVTIHSLLEFAIRPVFLADIVERLLALQGIQPPRKDVALSALVAIPQVSSGVMVDHSRDIDRQRIERFDGMPRGSLVACPGRSRLSRAIARRLAEWFAQWFALWTAFIARGAVEQIGQPAPAGRRWSGGAGGRIRVPPQRKTAWFEALRRTQRGFTARRRFTARRPLVVRRSLIARGRIAAGRTVVAAAGYSERRLLTCPAHGLDRIEISSVTGNNAIQFGQCLDLVHDDPTHLRGAFGRFLRQFEYPAPQFAARGFEFALHFRGHLLHALHGFGKALVCLAEDRLSVAGSLRVDRPQRFG